MHSSVHDKHLILYKPLRYFAYVFMWGLVTKATFTVLQLVTCNRIRKCMVCTLSSPLCTGERHH